MPKSANCIFKGKLFKEEFLFLQLNFFLLIFCVKYFALKPFYPFFNNMENLMFFFSNFILQVLEIPQRQGFYKVQIMLDSRIQENGKYFDTFCWVSFYKIENRCFFIQNYLKTT